MSPTVTPPTPGDAAPDDAATELGARERAYWRRNIRLVAILLAIWFAVSYGAGILLVQPLNALRIPGTGFPVGFWMAQQGSIYVFVLLIFVYAALMNRLDRRFAFDEGESPQREARRRRADAKWAERHGKARGHGEAAGHDEAPGRGPGEPPRTGDAEGRP